MFFTSPTSNITPAQAVVAMTRSDSRDSTTSAISFSYNDCYRSAYTSLAMSTSPTWPITSLPLARTESSTSNASSSSQVSPKRIPMRRESSTSWLASPYRSCQLQVSQSDSSYLSDDDLLFNTSDSDSLPIESIPSISSQLPWCTTSKVDGRELTTEEVIAQLREQQSREVLPTSDKRRVRFAPEGRPSSKPRRPSTLRRQTGMARPTKV